MEDVSVGMVAEWTGKNQIPPDLVVKTQPIDIIGIF
jgi:hypothetical protein